MRTQSDVGSGVVVAFRDQRRSLTKPYFRYVLAGIYLGEEDEEAREDSEGIGASAH